MEMTDWFSDLTVTGNRVPLELASDVKQRWGMELGDEVGRFVIAGRTNLELGNRMLDRDQSRRTLRIFDARRSQHEPPHFIVASESVLKRIAEARPLFRGLIARLSGEVHTIRAGDRLEIGDGPNRWLPRVLKKREAMIKSQGGAKAISAQQALFYVGEDMELHVRSEGYNRDELIAIPNKQETLHLKANTEQTAQYEEQMRNKLSQGRELRAKVDARLAHFTKKDAHTFTR